MSHDAQGSYYLPEPSHWPLVGSIGLFLATGGFALALTNQVDGSLGNMTISYIGLAIVIFMLFGWFGTVIKESMAGKYDSQVDTSFRMGMMWFILSEVMFFAAFFGALYYMRNFSVPWLGGAGNNAMTNAILHEGFQATWPTNGPGNVGGDYEAMPATGLPLWNTIILLTSGVTLTWAHHALKAGKNSQLVLGLFVTVALGILFLSFQIYEYGHAYSDLNLKLTTGAYGTTFFMLTGFHGFHVFVGATMLLIMLFRAMKGHFTAEHHFAFEAAAWYWHFVDVVWLGLFIFVYWLI
ncbi:Cytochrome c oxidase polypeptide III [hydrothermal vent metagenome]|uniref:cytochrome-c oxidase n=1 Tax=hydrothermal vent metagenome TaxID=652676 RepID=A0A3B1A497_9ZZZZ